MCELALLMEDYFFRLKKQLDSYKIKFGLNRKEFKFKNAKLYLTCLKISSLLSQRLFCDAENIIVYLESSLSLKIRKLWQFLDIDEVYFHICYSQGLKYDQDYIYDNDEHFWNLKYLYFPHTPYVSSYVILQ